MFGPHGNPEIERHHTGNKAPELKGQWFVKAILFTANFDRFRVVSSPLDSPKTHFADVARHDPQEEEYEHRCPE